MRYHVRDLGSRALSLRSVTEEHQQSHRKLKYATKPHKPREAGCLVRVKAHDSRELLLQAILFKSSIELEFLAMHSLLPEQVLSHLESHRACAY